MHGNYGSIDNDPVAAMRYTETRLGAISEYLLKDIEKGITEANLGVGVSADGQGLRVSFPELTSERRVQLSKIAGDQLRNSRGGLHGGIDAWSVEVDPAVPRY